MKDIFTGIFSKVFGFFSKAEKEDESAKEVAVNRLRVVLMQDRTNLTPELLEKMRGELIELLSKYVEMDKEALELNFEQEGDQMALMLSIPVLRAKEEDEIEADEEDSDDDVEESDESEKSEDDDDETSESEEDSAEVETEESDKKNSNTK